MRLAEAVEGLSGTGPVEDSPASNRIAIDSDVVRPARRPSGRQGQLPNVDFIVTCKVRYYYKDNNANDQYRINQRDLVSTA